MYLKKINYFLKVGSFLGIFLFSFSFYNINLLAELRDQAEIDFSELEEEDDLTTLKNDLGDDYISFESVAEKGASANLEKEEKKVKSKTFQKPKMVNESLALKTSQENIEIFDVGEEEKKLLEVAKYVQYKIKDDDWNEIMSSGKIDKYTVAEGEYLWKISQHLFGTGFYYSKIWSLNPYITNPHQIEPGMVLMFNRGDDLNMPYISVSSFENDSGKGQMRENLGGEKGEYIFDFSQFGDESMPHWVKEKKKLMENGHYFQFATEKTYEDLKVLGTASLIDEYQNYTPPITRFSSAIDTDKYDETGFSKESKVNYNFKEGLSLSTFISTNLVQDLGEIDSAIRPDSIISDHDHIFVRFNSGVKVVVGDFYSVYTPLGEVDHKMSDRSGKKYVIAGEIKVLKKMDDLWECLVTDSVSVISRRDRLTVHTPPLNKIITTFNTRNIEAVIVDSYNPGVLSASYGDVVYIDRGRADGVEIGNVFELFSFHDQLTDRKISRDPAFKIGEITVITLTDNFATVLITQSSQEIPIGSFGVTKTKEKAALQAKIKSREFLSNVKQMENDAVESLDTDLNLNDLNEDLLKEAQNIELTDDDLSELDRQEREKSFIEHSEADLRDLENLEAEIEKIEDLVNDQRIDEDKLLENQDLNKLEKKGLVKAKDIFQNLNSIEKEEGKKFLDQDINAQENPYGLTKFDIEEVNALINTIEPIEKESDDQSSNLEKPNKSSNN